MDAFLRYWITQEMEDILGSGFYHLDFEVIPDGLLYHPKAIPSIGMFHGALADITRGSSEESSTSRLHDRGWMAFTYSDRRNFIHWVQQMR